MKKGFLLLGLTVLLFSGCGSTYQYDIFGSISGVITDTADGSPLENVSVTIIPGAASILTGSDGKFEFTDLEEGQYTISAQKNGYQSNRKNISVISGETVSANTTLTRIPAN